MRPFGLAQVAGLERILQAGPSGISVSAALDLHGRAASYSSRYAVSLRGAIECHNAGRCPETCPVPSGHEIVQVSSPLGGTRYAVRAYWAAVADEARSMAPDEAAGLADRLREGGSLEAAWRLLSWAHATAEDLTVVAGWVQRRCRYQPAAASLLEALASHPHPCPAGVLLDAARAWRMTPAVALLACASAGYVEEVDVLVAAAIGRGQPASGQQADGRTAVEGAWRMLLSAQRRVTGGPKLHATRQAALSLLRNPGVSPDHVWPLVVVALGASGQTADRPATPEAVYQLVQSALGGVMTRARAEEVRQVLVGCPALPAHLRVGFGLLDEDRS